MARQEQHYSTSWHDRRGMDRLDEWRVFAQVATRRSFAEAARRQGRSPQAVTRAVASLEARLGTRLLRRTTRSVSLTDEGARYLERARTLLAELDALETPADRDAPLAGTLTIAASVLFGQLHVLPVVIEMARAHPALDLRLVLHDRVVSLAEEGIDLAVRLGELPDSSLRARRVGQVRLVVCASPTYLKRAGTPGEPADLARHDGIAFAGTTAVAERWSFPLPGAPRRARERAVSVRPRLTVNTAQAAIDAALAGLGVVRVLSYQVEALVRARRLRVILADFEPAPLPVHLVQLPGVPSRTATAFAELAAARLPGRLRPLPR
jgi:DNA-binding transcriptional LysR family regulator